MNERRRLLQALTAAGGAALLPRALRAADAPSPADDPFRLGVASGYPTDHSVVLWTRLAPRPDEPGGGMAPVDRHMEYEISSDAQFRRDLRRGTAVAEARFAHSVHAEVRGLKPARGYWYRFIAGAHASPVARTRTLPAPHAAVDALSIAVTCCQNYEHAYYAAWNHAAAAAPDLMLFVGDYIYENNARVRAVRAHATDEPRSLDEYRRRYAQYKQDPALQAAHQAAPWFAVWDDHDVLNDYAGETPGHEAEDHATFMARRAAAYQAWYEHLPVPPSMAPRDGVMRIYARARLGALATLHLLDQRQYRSPEACPRPPNFGGQRVGPDCAERLDPARTMLGAAQERWLEDGLREQTAAWTLLAQGTPFSQMNEGTGEAPQYWTDAWTGYPAARQRLLDSLQRTHAANPVILGGDIHAFVVAGVNAMAEQPDSPLLATELVATSIASNPVAQSELDKWRAVNPNLLKLDGTHRGYLALMLKPRQLRADLVAVDDATRADSPSRVSGSYVVEAGSPAIQSA